MVKETLFFVGIQTQHCPKVLALALVVFWKYWQFDTFAIQIEPMHKHFSKKT